MGALASFTPWLPQDDLLLKNSIEHGASLEALARGAVQFSRRFSMSELKDRWLSLLYDPVISEEAAARMAQLERLEFERSTAPFKSNKSNASKESKFGVGKRKAQSVRRCYYAMRKRIRNEPLQEDDFCFLDAPGGNCFMSGAEAPGRDSIHGDPMANHFRLGDGKVDDMQIGYPEETRVEFPIGQRNMLGDFMDCGIAQEVIPHSVGNCTRDGQLGLSKEAPDQSVSEANGVETNPVCNGEDMMDSGIAGNAIFNPPVCNSETSFDHLRYASSLSAMDSWKTSGVMSVPEMPHNVSLRDNNVETVDPFSIHDNDDADEGTIEHGIVNTQPELNNHLSFEDLKNSTGCPDGYFTEISESLFNFDDEMLGLSSFLLNSPGDATEDNISIMPETEEPAAADISSTSSTGTEEKSGACNTHLSGFIPRINAEISIPASSGTSNHEFPELRDGVICCVLNTEEPEIPCNDDVVFPSKQRAASVQRRPQNERKDPSLLGATSVGEFDRSKGDTLNSSRSPSVACRLTSQNCWAVKKEPPDEFVSSVPEIQGQVAESSHLQVGVGGINQVSQPRPEEESAEPMSVEPGEALTLSDPEDQFSESDSEIPCFSDIESMILDMDLEPGDDELRKEVEKYQHEDARRAIIRLEQSAHSYMQRDIASHGAFAVLYGQHSKHYIKKPEVLLGRATEGVNVDIDLAREGRGNKISRRQALIKMDKDGTFILKNMGQCSIFVNSREISPGQCLDLYSNCLIEIRRMPFIFEINQRCVKLYLDNATQ